MTIGEKSYKHLENLSSSYIILYNIIYFLICML